MKSTSFVHKQRFVLKLSLADARMVAVLPDPRGCAAWSQRVPRVFYRTINRTAGPGGAERGMTPQSPCQSAYLPRADSKYILALARHKCEEVWRHWAKEIRNGGKKMGEILKWWDERKTKKYIYELRKGNEKSVDLRIQGKERLKQPRNGG